jgi:divalent metal cation (Fe/Co/Zn/Cd) transporter
MAGTPDAAAPIPHRQDLVRELRVKALPQAPPAVDRACDDACCAPAVGVRSAAWQRAARTARRLAWASLVWMTIEGAVGLYAGIAASSIALIGWALGSGIEGLASLIVVWRFSGARTLSETAERRAQRAVAVSFWLLAPYVAVESVRDLAGAHHPEASILGIALTASSAVLMPLLGRAKQRLARELGSRATAGEGTQNFMCAAQAAAVLVGLAATALWTGAWWLDGAVGLLIAGWSVWEGRRAWQGEECC